MQGRKNLSALYGSYSNSSRCGCKYECSSCNPIQTTHSGTDTLVELLYHGQSAVAAAAIPKVPEVPAKEFFKVDVAAPIHVELAPELPDADRRHLEASWHLHQLVQE